MFRRRRASSTISAATMHSTNRYSSVAISIDTCENVAMTTRRQIVVTSAVVGAVAALPIGARSQSAPIRIGEINSYSTIPQFTVPYRMGWQLAVEEENAAGGLLGRRVEVISRDDSGKPEDAIRLATELRTNENVALITGTFLSNVGLAVADFALRN